MPVPIYLTWQVTENTEEVFVGGLAHIWCSKYLWQQDSVCGIEKS